MVSGQTEVSISDPLAPYLMLIKIGGAAAIASALFIGGCNHGKNKCEAKQLKAQSQAERAAVKQEALAPAIAQEARDAIEPVVTERVRIIREQIKSQPIACDTPYDDRVQQIIREAASAANNLRPSQSADP